MVVNITETIVLRNQTRALMNNEEEKSEQMLDLEKFSDVEYALGMSALEEEEEEGEAELVERFDIKYKQIEDLSSAEEEEEESEKVYEIVLPVL